MTDEEHERERAHGEALATEIRLARERSASLEQALAVLGDDHEHLKAAVQRALWLLSRKLMDDWAAEKAREVLHQVCGELEIEIKT